MDDFVIERLTQWGLRELIETFRDHRIDSKRLYYLEESDLDELISEVGPRITFRMELRLLKSQQKSKEGDNVLPSTSFRSTSDERKRKLDSHCESNEGQKAVKMQKETKSSSELRILSDVKDIMGNVLTKLHENTKVNNFLKSKINDLEKEKEKEKREMVGVFGKTGAGKSSLINAVITEDSLLPSGALDACTSVMIKLEANRINQKYEADIEFIAREEWEKELGNRKEFQNDNDESDDDDNNEDNDLDEKLSAVYPADWKLKSVKELMDDKYFKEIQEFLQSTRKTLRCESAKELSKKIMKYTRNGKNQEEDKDVKWFWPLVKCVTVRVPQNDFLQHVTLVDLPGNGDRNKSRNEMWKGIIQNCSAVWIVTELNRAASEKEAWEILESASSLLGNGGECRHIHFICTKSDAYVNENDNSRDSILNSIDKNNKEAKRLVNKEFNKLVGVKKHFSDDCFEVFTVSSKEFVNKKYLEPERTEIPRLQEFLQNLNDRHSETLNYVSGAHGILSLIQGASIRKEDGRNEEVCEALEKNLSLQIKSIGNEMETISRDLEKCLQEGVEKSKNSCEKTMKSVLYPAKRGGRGFHKQLKKLVENGGICRPKRGKEINLNMKLTSCLTESIDEKFRETFPNEGEVGPFNGAINKFSLGTKELKEKFKDLELHLIFLESEEQFLKTDLKKSIRNDKKAVYRSLTESVEKAMEDCYKKAAVFTGTGTLQNMRDTIEKHVNASKNIMFENAKNVMMDQLHQLMVEVQQRLENTKKSIELSLKTDEHSIPDVSAELQKVRKLYNELNNC